MSYSITVMFLALVLSAGCGKHGSGQGSSSPNGLVINEIAAHYQDDGSESMVEIVNNSRTVANLEGLGLFLTDTYFNGKRIWTGAGSLAPGERMVLSTADGTLVTGIDSGADFRLVLGRGAGDADDEFVRRSSIEKPAACYARGSYQRIPDISGDWRNMTYNSIGKANTVFDFRNSKKNAIWVWSTHMEEWLADDSKVIREVKALGYDHILLNYSAFDSESKARTARKFISACEESGLEVHAWIQCFHNSSGWISPVNDDSPTGEFRQDIFDDIISHARKYIEEFGVKGLHLDYIRFGGKAYAHTGGYQNGCAAVAEFCRQIKEFADSYDEGIMLSAALMADGKTSDGILQNGKYYYGQDAQAMGKSIDVLMPMTYRYSETTTFSEDWCKMVSRTYAGAGGISECWPGITTYNYPGGKIAGMSAEQILADLRLFEDAEARGIVLFRYGYGTFPDVNGLWTSNHQ